MSPAKAKKNIWAIEKVVSFLSFNLKPLFVNLFRDFISSHCSVRVNSPQPLDPKKITFCNNLLWCYNRHMPERASLGGCVTIGLVATLGISALINKVADSKAQDFNAQAALGNYPVEVTPTPYILPTMTSPPPVIVPAVCPRPEGIVSRGGDLKYEGVYYFKGELDSYPLILSNVRANYYGGGEKLNVHTATGEVFNPNEMAAASWFYPLGTWLNVTWEGNNVQVRVWDRGPNRVSHPDVFIDLTRAAMMALTGRAASAYGVTITPVC